MCFLYVMRFVKFVKMSISFHDVFLSPCPEFKHYRKYFFVKNLINISQWICCYNLFGPIFYSQHSARKQIELLLLLCSLLGNWYSSLYCIIPTRSRSNTKFVINKHKYFGANYKLNLQRSFSLNVLKFFFFFTK